LRIASRTNPRASRPRGLSGLSQRLIVIEQVSRAVRVLTQEGIRFRRLEAQALYADGLTTAQLASVLGVSRQRASALLRDGS
jgi:transcriptional regulator with XRE-family HTH domain